MSETENNSQESTFSENEPNIESEWDEASIKLSTIFPNEDLKRMKEIYTFWRSETDFEDEDLLNAVVQEILNDEQSSEKVENTLDITEQPQIDTEKLTIPETVKLENNDPISKNDSHDETESLQNDEQLPSTSRGTVSQDTQWHQTSLKLNQIFSNIDPEFIKNIYLRLSKDTEVKNQDFLNVVVQEILTNNKGNSQFEISSANEEDREVDTFEATSNEIVENKEESNFDVEQFLMLVPNAVEYFENPFRKCEYSLAMFELLKNHFRKLRLVTISNEYKKCSFNAGIAFESLQKMRVETKISREKTNLASENWQVRLEFDYIVNKQTIKDFIEQQKQHEKTMRDNRAHLECECCYEEINPSSTIAISCAEGHVFCKSCAVKGTDAELAKGLFRIKCFQDCSSEFNLNSLQTILMPDKFKILLQKIQEAEIEAANIEGLVSCPFCQFAVIAPGNNKVFTCLNQNCAKKSCRLCKKLDHSPKDCEEMEKNKKARLILEEKMTAALVRTCKCGREIIKNGGCNDMRCSCGRRFCYFCGKSGSSYSHARCGNLITKDTDAAAVVYVAKKIKDELLKVDPTLKIDVDSILPTVSRNVQIKVPTHALRQSAQLPNL